MLYTKVLNVRQNQRSTGQTEISSPPHCSTTYSAEGWLWLPCVVWQQVSPGSFRIGSPGRTIYTHAVHSLPIHTCVCVCQSGSIPGWLRWLLLQKWLVIRSRTWGLKENSGSPSLSQPSPLIPYLSYMLRWRLILFCARFLRLLVLEKSSVSHNGERIYFRGQETDPKSSEAVTLLEIWPIGYSVKKWLSFKILLSSGGGGEELIYSSLGVNEFNTSKRLLGLGREHQVRRKIQEIMQRKVL